MPLPRVAARALTEVVVRNQRPHDVPPIAQHRNDRLCVGCVASCRVHCGRLPPTRGAATSHTESMRSSEHARPTTSSRRRGRQRRVSHTHCPAAQRGWTRHRRSSPSAPLAADGAAAATASADPAGASAAASAAAVAARGRTVRQARPSNAAVVVRDCARHAASREERVRANTLNCWARRESSSCCAAARQHGPIDAEAVFVKVAVGRGSRGHANARLPRALARAEAPPPPAHGVQWTG